MACHFRAKRSRLVTAFLAVPLLCVVEAVLAESWPTYRGDTERSGYQDQALELPLHAAWVHHPSSPPAPAWPRPARRSYWQQLAHIQPRVVDDVTFQPIIAGQRLLYASSSDDHLHCLDLPTGRVAWRFGTDGPLRFAPVVSGQRVFLAGDDAHVYCLDLPTGELQWQRALPAADRRIPGNGRLISAWPVRTGLIVDQHILYVACGLYPTQGCHLHALDAANGEPLWQQAIEVSPQGYLLASPSLLFLPTGRATPIAVRREDGSFWKSLGGLPGSFAITYDERLVTGRGNLGELEVADLTSGQQIVRFDGEHLAISPQHTFLLGEGRLTSIDRQREAELRRQEAAWRGRRETVRRQLESAASQLDTAPDSLRRELLEITDQLDRIDEQLQSVKRWEVTTSCHSALIALRDFIICGGDHALEVRDSLSGELRQQLPIRGRVVGLAAADGWLAASNEAGEVLVFSDARHVARNAVEQQAVEPQGPWATSAAANQLLDRLFAGQPAGRGLALVLGAADPEWLQAMVDQTSWTIEALDRDPERVRAARDWLLDRGSYGHRVSVHLLSGPLLPYTDYCFNHVIERTGAVSEGAPWFDPHELQRVLRPYGGQYVRERPYRATRRAELEGAGSWTHQFASPENSANSGDQRIHANVQLQWFGGPGPERMVDRHLRGPAPLAARGLLVVPGENCLVGVDAYNGTELWHCDLPAAQRYALPYDGGYMSLGSEYVAVAVNHECWLIDVESGEPARTLDLPAEAGPAHWGFTAWHADRIIGTAQHPEASRRRPSREGIDEDYRNHQPLVTSHTLFALDPSDSQIKWIVRDGALLNTTLTVTSDRIFYVTCRSKQLPPELNGRIPLSQLLSEEVLLVARDVRDGRLLWERPLEAALMPSDNVLYLQHHDGWLVLLGSWRHESSDTWYQLAVHRAAGGEVVWTAGHLVGKPGEFSHGEQVHHPVVVDGMVVAEPRAYELATGRRIDPTGVAESWSLIRPGHSCGTISAAGRCLFFRAGQPTLLDLTSGERSEPRYVPLSPSRPGCWINIIPACGLVLVPEASAGCVCHYSLQTSMAFLPAP